MISAVAWIPRGAAKPIPKRYDQDVEEEELKNKGVDEDAQEDLKDLENDSDIEEDEEIIEDEEEDEEESEDEDEEEEIMEEEIEKEIISEPMDPEKAFNDRYKMDEYDDDDEEGMDEEERGMKFINKAMKGLMYYKNPDKDPYLGVGDDEEVEDLEDIIIRPSDSLLIAAIANDEDDFSHLNLYVYEEDVDNLYIHHDIILGSFPLSVAWMDQNPSNPTEKGNYVAVGSFDSTIDIWDLDVIDNLLPTVSLGKSDVDKGKKKKKAPTMVAGSHLGSVISLSWNTQQRNVLASGSSDKTIKVWDITKQQCVNTFTHHKDIVQTVEWNKQEKTVLLCGSNDKTISIVDVRFTDASTFFRWTNKSSVERVMWNPHNPKEFIVGTEDGKLTCYDATMGSNSKPVWSLQAHEGACSAFSFSSQPGLFATGSADHTVKLWKMDSSNNPTLLEKRGLGSEVFTLSFFSSSPYLLAIGSENTTPHVINTRRFKSVQTTFNVEAPEGQKSDPSLESKKKKKVNKKKKVGDDNDSDTDSESELDDEDN